jgi:hypothetical protein
VGMCVTLHIFLKEKFQNWFHLFAINFLGYKNWLTTRCGKEKKKKKQFYTCNFHLFLFLFLVKTVKCHFNIDPTLARATNNIYIKKQNFVGNG